jgi:hypothetical protein
MSLATSLISYWKLDESSGNAADSFASNPLTNTGTCTYAGGLINNAAQNASSGQYLGVTNTLGLAVNSDFSLSMWINLASEDTNDHDIWGMVFTGGSGALWRIMYEYNGGTRRLRLYRNGSTTTFVDITGNIANGSWLHLGISYTGGTGAIKLYKNYSTTATGTHTNTGSQGSGNQFTILNSQGSGFSSPLAGKMDEVGIWSRVLSDTEFSTLYNGGAGYAYSLIAPASGNSRFFALM